MTSAFTTRNRFNKQADGDNTNTWGDVMNAGVFDMMDLALDGWAYLTPSVSFTLTTVNGGADQARCRGLKYLPGSAAVTTTIPPLEKIYFIWNASTAVQTIASAGGGTSVAVQPGEVVWTCCDGVNVVRTTLVTDGAGLTLSGPLNVSGNKVTNLANGAASTDAVNYGQMSTAISQAVFTVGQFGVPIAPGDSGKLLTNNGSTPSWTNAFAASVAGRTGAVTLTTADLTDYVADQATRAAAIKTADAALAAAFAICL